MDLSAALLLSLFFAILISYFSRHIDKAFYQLCLYWKNRGKELHDMEEELNWISHIMAHMKAGISLQNALEAYGKEGKSSDMKKISYSILNERPPKKGIFTFLAQAIRLGSSILPVLQLQKQELRKQLQLKKKLNSLSLQTRTQAWIAVFLPWFLLSFLFFSHGDIFNHASKKELFWFLIFIAIILDIIAAYWIRYLLKHSFRSRSAIEHSIHKWIPMVLLNAVQNIHLGLDLQSSLENSLLLIPKEDPLRSLLLKASPEAPLIIRHISDLFQKSAKIGSPVTENIYEIISDIRENKEIMMEEACQLLPVKLLLPIFTLILPASLLTIVAPIITQLDGFL